MQPLFRQKGQRVTAARKAVIIQWPGTGNVRVNHSKQALLCGCWRCVGACGGIEIETLAARVPRIVSFPADHLLIRRIIQL